MRYCSRCRYSNVTCECVHCSRDLCDDCAEKGCCSRIPAVVSKFFPPKEKEEGRPPRIGHYATTAPKREIKE